MYPNSEHKLMQTWVSIQLNYTPLQFHMIQDIITSIFMYCLRTVFFSNDIFKIFTGAACTFPSYMTGIWYDNKFVKAEFQSSSTLFLSEYAITRDKINKWTNLTCYSNNGNRYILR